MPKAGPRKETQKEKKKIMTASLGTTSLGKLAEEEAKKVSDKTKKKLFDHKKDTSEQDAKLRKKPERNVHR